MATHQVHNVFRGNLQSNVQCRNGMPVSGTLAKQINQGLNQVAVYHKKFVFAKSVWGGPIADGGGATIEPFQFYFHAGHNDKELVFDMLLATALAGTDPYVSWDVTEVGVGTVETGKYHFSAINASPNDTPDEFTRAQIRYTLPTTNAAYSVRVNLVDYARITAASAYTVGINPADDTNTGVVDPRLSAGSSILSADVASYLDAGTEHWQRGAAHLFSWSRDSAAVAVSVNSTTYTNPFDATTGDPLATTWGQRLVTTYHNSLSASTVPCVMAVLAQRIAGIGAGSVQLIDTGGTTYAEVTGIDSTADTWYLDTSVPWPAGSTKFDIQGKISGTMRIDAVCLYQLE